MIVPKSMTVFWYSTFRAKSGSLVWMSLIFYLILSRSSVSRISFSTLVEILSVFWTFLFHLSISASVIYYQGPFSTGAALISTAATGVGITIGAPTFMFLIISIISSVFSWNSLTSVLHPIKDSICSECAVYSFFMLSISTCSSSSAFLVTASSSFIFLSRSSFFAYYSILTFWIISSIHERSTGPPSEDFIFLSILICSCRAISLFSRSTMRYSCSLCMSMVTSGSKLTVDFLPGPFSSSVILLLWEFN